MQDKIVRVNFFELCESGDVKSIKALMKENHMNAGVARDYGIQIAAVSGNWSVVRFLVAKSNAVPSACKYAFDCCVSMGGDLNIIELLLNRPGLVSVTEVTLGFQQAAMYGYLEIVQFLLKQPSVDIAANDNYALRMAALNKHSKVVEIIKQDLVRRDVHQKFFLNNKEGPYQYLNKGLLFFKAMNCHKALPLPKELFCEIATQAAKVILNEQHVKRGI